MGTSVLSLRMDGELLDRLRQHAAKRGMSVQDYVVRTLIRDDFDERFPDGVPSLRSAEELTVTGDWTIEAGVAVEGRAHLDGPGGRVEAGRTLGG